MKQALTIVVFCTLLLGTGAIWLFRQSAVQSPSKSDYYNALVPTEITGWRIKDLPLADTDLGVDATRDILDFDAVVHRSFRRGELEITLFLLYWSPAKNVLPRRIAFHSPDNCWRESGYIRTNYVDNTELSIGKSNLIPGYYRTYQFQKEPVHVFFWQFWGDEPVYYLKNGDAMPSDWSLVSDLFNRRIYEKQHQLYVRLTSNIAFDQLHEEGILTPFETVFRKLKLNKDGRMKGNL